MARANCDTQAVGEHKFVIGARTRLTRRSPLVRLRDGLTRSTGGWDDVWAACPEFNVPWRTSSSRMTSSATRC